jgi:hypothetical protein
MFGVFRMETTPRRNRDLVTGLGVLQLFIGLGAVGGGLVLILDPSGSKLGIPVELLKNTPFSTYLVPGIVLYLTSARFGHGMIFSKLWFAYNKTKQGDIYECKNKSLT